MTDDDTDEFRSKVRSFLDEDPMFNPPTEAIEAHPDQCANCGADAAPFFIPADYHEQDDPDPGICTEYADSDLPDSLREKRSRLPTEESTGRAERDGATPRECGHHFGTGKPRGERR